MHRSLFRSPGDVNTRNDDAKSREKSAERIIISVTDSKQFNHSSADGEAVNRRTRLSSSHVFLTPAPNQHSRALTFAKWCHEYESFGRKKTSMQIPTSSARFGRKGKKSGRSKIREFGTLLHSGSRTRRADHTRSSKHQSEAEWRSSTTLPVLKAVGGGRGEGGEGHRNTWIFGLEFHWM